MAISFSLNGVDVTVDVEQQMPLLWVLRDVLSSTGTKYGCGKGLCGACTVHIDGAAARSCVVPITSVSGRAVTTIEGLSQDGLHPLQAAWIEAQAPQCGYCQPGQIMSAAALLAAQPNPSASEIEAAMRGNICRCGSYGRIRAAIARAVAAR